VTRSTTTRCRWHTDDGRCLGHPLPNTPELCEQHLALLDPWVNSRALAMANDMRPMIEGQVRQQLAASRGRKPSAKRQLPRSLSADEQRLLDSLTDNRMAQLIHP
jgi:hypothetical protein